MAHIELLKYTEDSYIIKIEIDDNIIIMINNKEVKGYNNFKFELLLLKLRTFFFLHSFTINNIQVINKIIIIIRKIILGDITLG
jgi:hypothetical protein